MRKSKSKTWSILRKNVSVKKIKSQKLDLFWTQKFEFKFKFRPACFTLLVIGINFENFTNIRSFNEKVFKKNSKVYFYFLKLWSLYYLAFGEGQKDSVERLVRKLKKFFFLSYKIAKSSSWCWRVFIDKTLHLKAKYLLFNNYKLLKMAF